MRWMRTAVWVGVGLACVGASAQQAWTVRPEWVRAHESFLASDAMRGRGSATHDEEITATYVASEFEAYGLKTAPGMTGYIQSAEVVGPQLAGPAELVAGGVRLKDGLGMSLLVSSGQSVSGALLKVDGGAVKGLKDAKGKVVVLTSAPAADAMRPLMRSGAALVVMPESADTERMHVMGGGKPRVSLRLKDAEGFSGGGARSSIVTLDAADLAKLDAEPDGETVTLTVPVSKDAAERRTYNAIGYLPGTDAAAGTILLTAHLDHLGVGTPVDGDAIWNGADDDAAGTTAVLELAHALASGPRLKRSVLFVCYGSEELGGLGSTYFGAHPPVPLKSLVANLEFEMIGIQDPGMPKGVLLLTGWDRSNLGPTLKAHGALLGPDPYPEEHYFQRSDNYSLALLGVVAQTAAGWGSGPTYHHPDDDLAHIDIPFMTAAIQSLVEPMRWLADSDFVPQWNAGGKPERQ